jgi:2,4-dienoyl-CoA reductase-like NADH-dependent reductase (Old Yellow Enzyme family)
MFGALETPAQTDKKSERTLAREGFFIQASQEVRLRFPELVLFVTGGFRSRLGINRALQSGACDAVGIGRPSVKFPDLPKRFMFNTNLDDEGARFDVGTASSTGYLSSKIRSIGAGAETVSCGQLSSIVLLPRLPTNHKE